MATVPKPQVDRKVEYPTSDGKPMAETEIHRNLMMDLIQTLQRRFADDPRVCVSGNLMMYYEEGNKHRHASPDVFVVFGIPRRERPYYLVWDEGKGPDVVIELTSKSTKSKDEKQKKDLYRDVLRVPEYFLFDPTQDYLRPPLQGFRLVGEEYEPIEPINGRLPSALLGLYLERDGKQLRLYDPRTRRRLPTPAEAEAKLATAAQEAKAARRQAEARAAEEEAARRQAEAANERLRQELEAMRKRLESGG